MLKLAYKNIYHNNIVGMTIGTQSIFWYIIIINVDIRTKWVGKYQNK